MSNQQGRMTGKERFQRYNAALGSLGWIMRVVPSWSARWLWSMSRGVGGSVGIGIRYSFLKAKAKRCGMNVFVGRDVEIRAIDRLEVGSNVSIHLWCYIDALGGIAIGDNVSIAHGCSLLSFNHTWSDPDLPIKYNEMAELPIRIEEDVWIGAGARILGGVNIGARSVVGAGAVVTRDVERRTVVGGVPARRLREI